MNRCEQVPKTVSCYPLGVHLTVAAIVDNYCLWYLPLDGDLRVFSMLPLYIPGWIMFAVGQVLWFSHGLDEQWMARLMLVPAAGQWQWAVGRVVLAVPTLLVYPSSPALAGLCFIGSAVLSLFDAYRHTFGLGQ